MKFIIETDRFYLRRFQKEDIQDLFELDSDSLVHQYLGNKPIKNIDEAKKAFEKVRTQYEKYGLGRLAIIDKRNDDFIGWSGLKYETININNQNGYYDLGYRLKRKHWGKGIATETGIAALAYGFNKLKIEKICAAADVENLASNRVLQKIGMNFVNTFFFEGIKCRWFESYTTKKNI
jgi:ribosomal-protein-alanine N-acetyltransferase